MAYDQGIALPYGQRLATPDDYLAIAINYYPNRNPLSTRLSKVPVGANAIKLVGCEYRPRNLTLGAAIADGVATTITVSDASGLLLGDVLELNSGEFVEVTADPNTTNNTLTVRRGVSNTTAAAQGNTTPVRVIGNSRTGGEINVSAMTFRPNPDTQYPQTFQHPYQIGGATEGLTNIVTPPGTSSPLGRERMLAMQNIMDDMEYSSFYGKADPYAANVQRQKQNGLVNILLTNKQLAPTNAANYKPSDLIRDVIQPAFDGGGRPDVMFVSTDFMTGLATWGMNVQMLSAGTTAYGTPIELFYVSFLPGISIIPAPLLRKGWAFALNSQEVAWGEKRRIRDKPRGSRGDAEEGDLIAEGCIVVENEKHHACVGNITGWAKQG